MTNALVTGAAGFIGSHFVDELLARGYTVWGLDDLSTGNRENLDSAMVHDSFTFVTGDIRDTERLSTVLDEVDVVFHQAAVASVRQSFETPSSVASVNCTGTSTLFEVAAETGVETIVVASSAAVYGSGGELPKREDMPVNPESPYALSKYYTEQAALQLGEQYGINATALRYFNVFGPRQDPAGAYAAVIPKFIDLLLDGDQPVIFGDGKQTRDFIFVKDVVRAALAAVEAEKTGVFNIASGNRISINDLVYELNGILETDIEPVYEEPRPGDIRHSKADVSKAQEAFGYDTEMPFKQGLKETVAWFDT